MTKDYKKVLAERDAAADAVREYAITADKVSHLLAQIEASNKRVDAFNSPILKLVA